MRGLILWGLAALTAVFCRVKDKSIEHLGFCRPKKGSLKRQYYFIPPIFAALAAFSLGTDADNDLGTICADLFPALGIGFCEEIYFRGILFNLWLKKGERTAVAVSSALFAVCHLMNAAGGAGTAETALQICFALVYGVVFSLIFIVCNSIRPCIALHAFHDFCSFLSAEGSVLGAAAVGAVQFMTLLCYALAVTAGKKATGRE